MHGDISSRSVLSGGENAVQRYEDTLASGCALEVLFMMINIICILSYHSSLTDLTRLAVPQSFEHSCHRI